MARPRQAVKRSSSPRTPAAGPASWASVAAAAMRMKRRRVGAALMAPAPQPSGAGGSDALGRVVQAHDRP